MRVWPSFFILAEVAVLELEYEAWLTTLDRELRQVANSASAARVLRQEFLRTREIGQAT